MDIISASSCRSRLSAPQYQKTILLARAEKEERSALLLSPGTSADLIPTLVNVNVDAGTASLVKARTSGLSGGASSDCPPCRTSLIAEMSATSRAMWVGPWDAGGISPSQGACGTQARQSRHCNLCAHALPREYSFARTAFCTDRSSLFLFNTDFGWGKDDPPWGCGDGGRCSRRCG